MDEIRPKRKDHTQATRGLMWIKQNEYDAICGFLNRLSDVQLGRYLKQLRVVMQRRAMVDHHGKTRYAWVDIPIGVDSGVVHWMAKEILKERRKQAVAKKQ